MSKDNSLMMFFAGVGIGVAGTLLLAPSSGREMRSRIRGSANRGGDYLRQQADSWKSSVDDAVAAGQQAFHESVSKGADSVSNLKDKVKDKIDDASERAKDTADNAIDKTRELAHQAGKSMEKGGKRLQDA